MAYEPKPLDTEKVELSDDLVRLTETLAEHIHDRWALRRMAEGWKPGPRLSERTKEHPDLIPYAELPPGEQEYDRVTVRETLKALIQLGYRIEHPQGRPRTRS